MFREDIDSYMAVNLKIVGRVNKIPALHRFVRHMCFLCKAVCVDYAPLCLNCQHDLPVILYACPGCGLPREDNELCATCLGSKQRVIEGISCVYRYCFPTSILIQHMKFNSRPDLAVFLGSRIARKLLLTGRVLPEVLVPVPLHPARLAERGYNQAAELARTISLRTGAPVDLQFCHRQKPGTPQAGLDATARRHNVKDAFSCSAMNKYRHVAIVDDVVTTGSTVNELARVLIRSGVSRVDVWACARAVSLF